MANPTKRQFYEFALERMKQEHSDLLDVWKQMDSKAQATASIAGGFLAAAFAFVRNSLLSLGIFEKTMLSAAVILLVVTIGFALASMRVRVTFSPLTGGQTLKTVEDILDKEAAEAAERYIRMLGTTLRAWAKVNDQLRKANESKSDNLRWAQSALFYSAAAVLVLTVASIIEPPTTTEGSKNGTQTSLRR